VITISQLSLDGLATPAVMVTEGVLPKQTGDMADNVKLVKAAALSACANPTGKTANASNTVPKSAAIGFLFPILCFMFDYIFEIFATEKVPKNRAVWGHGFPVGLEYASAVRPKTVVRCP
jgi:hypothetical protein